MSRSLLGSFVSGTRQVLFVQLFISVGAVSLAGWTLAVTNDLIRERASLNDRVIQLEEELAKNNIVPPSVRVTEATPDTQDAYPPPTSPPDPATPADAAPPLVDEAGRPIEPATPPAETPGTRGEASGERPSVAEVQPFNPATIFAAAPPLRTIVLHVRTQEDSAIAQRIARELSSNDVRVAVDVMPLRDPRPSGYSYFDGRQSRAAAQAVQSFNDIARRYEIAPWAVQLRGVALPALGEYTADRLDILLPPLPRTEPAAPVDPRTIYRERTPG